MAIDDLRICRKMSVILGKRNRPEPDLMAVKADAVTEEAEETGYHPEDVLLAVEVVPPESTERDRKRKPQLYAEAARAATNLPERGHLTRQAARVHELLRSSGSQ